MPISWCQRSREIPRRSKSSLLTGSSGDVLQCILLRCWICSWCPSQIDIVDPASWSTGTDDSRESTYQINHTATEHFSTEWWTQHCRKALRTRHVVTKLDLDQRFESWGHTDVICLRFVDSSASFYERRHDLDLFFKISLRDLLSYPYERILFSDESRDRRDVGSVDLVLRVDVCRNHSLSNHVLIGTLMDVLRRDRIVFSNHRALLDRAPWTSISWRTSCNS